MAVAAVAVAAVLTLVVAGSAPAVAATGESTTTGAGVMDEQTGRCLDSNAAGKVYTNPCQVPGNHYQDWVETASGSSVSFKDVATGRCLDSNAAGNLYTNPCQAPGNQYQDWDPSASRFLDNATKRCLDSNTAGNAYTLPCNGGNFQNWKPYAGPAPEPPMDNPTCRHAVGPFHVSGTQVLDGHGAPFTPYGITVPGLANVNWPRYLGIDETKIRATAALWCANTVRLQVSQNNLVGIRGNTLNNGYMRAIETEVHLAESLGMVVVINDQTETDNQLKPPVTYQLAPTRGTETFWSDVSKVYGADPQVIFDLFNEPQIPANDWSLWYYGGTFQRSSYIGMSQLVSSVRAAGAKNVFWVEGPDYAASFAGLERPITRPSDARVRRANALLDAPDIVYDFHHPAPYRGQCKQAEASCAWYRDFGYLVHTGVAPVVDGEWTNYQPFAGSSTACWPDALTTIPDYLSYLAHYGIGMTAYQLAQGLLTTSNTNLGSPTTVTSKWSCTSTGGAPSNEGAGALIMNWYRQQNG